MPVTKQDRSCIDRRASPTSMPRSSSFSTGQWGWGAAAMALECGTRERCSSRARRWSSSPTRSAWSSQCGSTSGSSRRGQGDWLGWWAISALRLVRNVRGGGPEAFRSARIHGPSTRNFAWQARGSSRRAIFWPSLEQVLPESGRLLAKIGRCRTEFGRSWAEFGRSTCGMSTVDVFPTHPSEGTFRDLGSFRRGRGIILGLGEGGITMLPGFLTIWRKEAIPQNTQRITLRRPGLGTVAPNALQHDR